jgi:hypothetical protein
LPKSAGTLRRGGEPDGVACFFGFSLRGEGSAVYGDGSVQPRRNQGRNLESGPADPSDSRHQNTLTPTDRAKIDTTIQKSEPFFKEKIIHRLEGTTGRGNVARCICTYLRGEGANFRRTFKIVMLTDVGPGWQIVRSRDLYPLWTNQGKPTHHYNPNLGGIRVTDHVTDLGVINLAPP